MQTLVQCPEEYRSLQLVPFSTYGVGGWSHMMEIFHPDYTAPFSRQRILALGLDPIITGNCDWLFEWENGDCGWIRDPYKPWTICNGVMTFNRAGAADMWNRFMEARESRFSEFLNMGLPSEMVLMRRAWEEGGKQEVELLEGKPDKLLSYKAHIPLVALPGEASYIMPSIVYFHGSPKPHELENGHWLKKIWNS